MRTARSSYIDHCAVEGAHVLLHSWEQDLLQRLEWFHGDDARRHQAINHREIEAWNRLGQRAAA